MTPRRYAVLSALLATALVFGAFRLGQATTSVTFDAAWWRDASRSDQVAAVEGMIEGYGAGYYRGKLGGYSEQIAIDDNFDDLTGTAYFTGVKAQYWTGYQKYVAGLINNDRFDAVWAKARAKATSDGRIAKQPAFPDTFGTYVDGITHFYENQESKSAWTIGEVMECLSTIPPTACKS